MRLRHGRVAEDETPRGDIVEDRNDRNRWRAYVLIMLPGNPFSEERKEELYTPVVLARVGKPA